MRTPFVLLLALAGLGGCKSMYVGGDVGARSDAREWIYNSDGGEAKLAYGTPQSDDVPLMLSCAGGSRTVTVSQDGLEPGRGITIASGGRSMTLHGEEQADMLNGSGVIVTAQTSPDAPVLRSFRRTGRLELVTKEGRAELPVRRQERSLVDQFFARCSA